MTSGPVGWPLGSLEALVDTITTDFAMSSYRERSVPEGLIQD